MRDPVDLSLEPGPDSVPKARSVVASVVTAADRAQVDDVLLVVTELVTNAVLHGTAPITLRVSLLDDGVRVAVTDHGRAMPVRPEPSLDAMTGRGLSLVAATARSWGVEPADDGGKVVWAEVGPAFGSDAGAGGPDLDAEALLAAWDDLEPAEPTYPVQLGYVPTSLLMDAKRHMDNVVRELTLLRGQYESAGAPLPPGIAALVDAATVDFAEARGEIRRQALRAAERGETFTDLRLDLPLSAAAAGERYLAALDEVDRHARAARLLTLAPPRSHQAFREWYVRRLIGQLRAAATGEPVPVPEAFAEELAREVDRLAALQESSDRLAMLQLMAAQLAGARTVGEIATAVVDNVARYPGVLTARVFVPGPHRTLVSVARHPASDDDPYDEFSLDADLPGSVVARSREALFLRSREQIYAAFPQLTGYYPDDLSLHLSPLCVQDRLVGLFTLTFVAGDVPDDTQIAFVQAVADMLAGAIDRVYVAERAAAERGRELELLTAQLDALTGIVSGLPLGTVLEALLKAIERASPADVLGSVLLLSDDGAHLQHCAAPSLPEFYNEAIDGVAIGPGVGSCGTAAFRQQQVVVEDVATDALWVDFRDLAAQAGLRACWSTPIFGRDGALLGTFAMYYPRPQRPTPVDQTLIDVMVRTVAMLIERSRVDEERDRELAAERAAALTLQHSLLPAVPARIGAMLLESRYRTGDPGVEVGGDWFDAVEADGAVTLIVGDVQGHDLRAAALMGELRTVARSCAVEGAPPAQVLARVHRYLSRAPSELLATAVVVRIEAGTRRATVASAGHLPPLLLIPSRPGWTAGDLPLEVGPPLSVGEEWTEQESVLADGAVLLLYTDGLVESRAWPLQHGLEALQECLSRLPAGTGLAAIVDAALELVPTGSRGDDVAVLAATVRDAEGGPR